MTFMLFVVKLTKTYVCYWEDKSPFLRNICATGKIKVHFCIISFSWHKILYLVEDENEAPALAPHQPKLCIS